MNRLVGTESWDGGRHIHTHIHMHTRDWPSIKTKIPARIKQTFRTGTEGVMNREGAIFFVLINQVFR